MHHLLHPMLLSPLQIHPVASGTPLGKRVEDEDTVAASAHLADTLWDRDLYRPYFVTLVIRPHGIWGTSLCPYFI